MDPKSPGGTSLSFQSNKTLEQRFWDKHLGYMKHLLIEEKKYDPNDVKIKWSQYCVEVDKVNVAWFDKDGTYKTGGVGDDLQDEVVRLANEWLSKRSGSKKPVG